MSVYIILVFDGSDIKYSDRDNGYDGQFGQWEHIFNLVAAVGSPSENVQVVADIEVVQDASVAEPQQEHEEADGHDSTAFRDHAHDYRHHQRGLPSAHSWLRLVPRRQV
mmetsp:Transcript_37721/g.27803  ORF Transcript_37721/g.27803 Transcript_37721/m.27803 type:complete len:109 (-) Transcript_37721:582-908(-)